MIGLNIKVQFWFDNWLGKPSIGLIPPNIEVPNPDLLVFDALGSYFTWNLDAEFIENFSHLVEGELRLQWFLLLRKIWFPGCLLPRAK